MRGFGIGDLVGGVGARPFRLCIGGAGLGVYLGIASQSSSGDTKMTPEERTEALLDLHGLHAAEATEVLEEFLLAVGSTITFDCVLFADRFTSARERALLWSG